MRVGDMLRVPRPAAPQPAAIDGLPNVYHVTFGAGPKTIPLSAGINPIKSTNGRLPAILIRSSPHKAGTDVTPWQDRLEPDRGHVQYFGDNKLATGVPADQSQGNRRLLQLFRLHTSPERSDRLIAAPLVFFEGTPFDGRIKGQVRFQGYGLLRRAELVTQLDPRTKRPFTNYVYDCLVMSLAKEDEKFDWVWIEARRDPTYTDEACLRAAPAAWRDWVNHGEAAIDRVRRHVATMQTTPTTEQQPASGSPEARVLRAVYEHYQHQKPRFESLAAAIAERILNRPGTIYRPGWVTRSVGEGGIDFVGRLDVGDGFSRASLVVLGQAKCEKLTKPTGGVHIARTVARLKRGWVGVYVTTSYFSIKVQQEVLEDKYPIVLVPGRRVAEEVRALMLERRASSVESLLTEIDQEHPVQTGLRDPADVLLLGSAASSPSEQ